MRILSAIILVFSLCSVTINAEQVYTDNVVIVLDASGSMRRQMKGARKTSKMEAAKKAIKEVLKTIPQSTQVGLLVFGPSSNKWVYQLGPRNDGELFEALYKIKAGGGTPLGEYMKIGADKLLDVRKSQFGYGSYRLLIVTDGEANDPSMVELFTPDIISRGIVTDVIGVDMKEAHTLATKVHSYRSANDPASLKKAIQEVFAEVGKATDSQTGENAFEEISGLPDDAAMTIINSMQSSGNHPIGNGEKTPKPAQGSVMPPQKPTATSQNAKPKSSLITWKFIIPVVVIGAFVINRFIK